MRSAIGNSIDRIVNLTQEAADTFSNSDQNGNMHA